MRIKGNREFTDVTGTGVSIQYFIESFSIRTFGMYDTSLFKLKSYPVKGSALIDCWRIKCNVAFDGISDRAGEDLSIGNIMTPTTGNGSDSFDREL